MRPSHAAAAIVVLGARVLPDGRPGVALQRRMHIALTLYRAGVAPLLLLSGGGRSPRTEAEAMRRMALADRVPETALLLEPHSQDTVENALECARLLAARGRGPVILVTDRWHGLRARLLFRMAGLSVRQVARAPTPMATLLPMGLVEAAKLPFSMARMLYRRAGVRGRTRGR